MISKIIAFWILGVAIHIYTERKSIDWIEMLLCIVWPISYLVAIAIILRRL